MSYKTTKTVDIRRSVHRHTIVGNRLRRQRLLFSFKSREFCGPIWANEPNNGRSNKIVQINFCLWLLIDFQWNRSAAAVEVAARAWVVPTAPRHAERGGEASWRASAAFLIAQTRSSAINYCLPRCSLLVWRLLRWSGSLFIHPCRKKNSLFGDVVRAFPARIPTHVGIRWSRSWFDLHFSDNRFSVRFPPWFSIGLLSSLFCCCSIHLARASFRRI